MIDGQSLNLTHERIMALKALMPDVFSEGKIDVERLRQALGEEVFVKNEHYELSWAGKADARREIQRQTTATLTPDRPASVDFDPSDNVFIEGENLEVLRVLQRSYFGRVKVIYIDPPYNTGNDSFIYPDDYAERLDEYRQRSGLADENKYLNKQDLWQLNRRENGQFHSVWLSMMYPRLFLARNLLREDGVIFVSIDDNEVANLKALLNEIFGEENFVANICWQKKQSPQNDVTYFSDMHDFVLVYAKQAKRYKNDILGWQRILMARSDEQNERYSNPDNDGRGPWASVDVTSNKSKEQRPTLYYSVINPHSQSEIWPNPQSVWRFEKNKFKELIDEDRIWWGSNKKGFPRQKRFLSEVQEGIVPSTWWTRDFAGDNQSARREIRTIFTEGTIDFDTPKPVSLIQQILKITTESTNNSLVLDFFAGSATTAQAVLELNAEDGGNRSFVLVQLPEPTDPKSETNRAGFQTIADVSRERIRRVIQKMHRQTDEVAQSIDSLSETITAKNVQLAELRAGRPAEIFDVTNPPKAVQRLVDEIANLENKRAETREQHGRLQQTAKNFRAYRLSPSNFNVWQSEATDKTSIEQLLINFTQSDKPGAEAERMLTEFLLKTGNTLNTPVEVLDLEGTPAYSIADGQLLVLLDGYNEAINDLIWNTHPQHVVCLDRLFDGRDELLANLELELLDRGIKLSVL